MKNSVDVRIVESISEQITTIEERIRVRAYENYQMRDPESNSELEDWLAAEKELIRRLAVNVVEEDKHFVAQVALSQNEFKSLEVHATKEEILLSGRTPAAVFGLIHFKQPIEPAKIRVEFSKGMLRLTAPIGTTKSTFRQTA